MANIFGRQVVVPLTNKSGGGVVLGDVVIVDTGNNAAFTTTTSAAALTVVGVAAETIANNASGRVIVEGYAPLVNVNASVTRGNFGATHTVAKQAAETASRGVGTFCRFLTGGTTPTAYLWPVDLLGTSLTNPMTTAGDIIVGGASGAPARLAAGTLGFPLVGAGAGVASAYAAAGKGHGWHAFHGSAQTASPLAFSGADIIDTDAYHDTVTNNTRATIPAGLGGLYIVGFNSLAPAATDAKFRKNGTTTVGGRAYPDSTSYTGMFALVALAATDYLEVINGGGSWGHATVFDAQSQFWGILIGT